MSCPYLLYDFIGRVDKFQIYLVLEYQIYCEQFVHHLVMLLLYLMMLQKCTYSLVLLRMLILHLSLIFFHNHLGINVENIRSIIISFQVRGDRVKIMLCSSLNCCKDNAHYSVIFRSNTASMETDYNAPCG